MRHELGREPRPPPQLRTPTTPPPPWALRGKLLPASDEEVSPDQLDLTYLALEVACDWLQKWDQQSHIRIQALARLAGAWHRSGTSTHIHRSALQRLRALQQAAQCGFLSADMDDPEGNFVMEVVLRAALRCPTLLRGRLLSERLMHWNFRQGALCDGRPSFSLPVLVTQTPAWTHYPKLTVAYGIGRMHCSECDLRFDIDNLAHCAKCAAWTCYRCCSELKTLVRASPGDYLQLAIHQCRCGAVLRHIDDWLSAIRLMESLPKSRHDCAPLFEVPTTPQDNRQR